MKAATISSAAEDVRQYGYAFTPGALIREWATRIGSLEDWQSFKDSWNRLGPDLPLAKLGRQRQRRHASFLALPDADLRRLEHRAHYQSVDHNPIQGGIQRWFEPIEADVINGPSLQTLIEFGRRFFAEVARAHAEWLIEVHQFRIEAHPDRIGEPTPEGVHRDGVDWVLVVLIDRINIESGTTSIHANTGVLLGSFTLSQPFDAALVDDRRVMHGVTPVEPRDPERPAYRDVLVVTFRNLLPNESPLSIL